MTSSSINDISGLSYVHGTNGQNKKAGFRAEEELAGMFQNAMNLAKDNSSANLSDDSSTGKVTKTFTNQQTVAAPKAQYDFERIKPGAVSDAQKDNQVSGNQKAERDDLDSKEVDGSDIRDDINEKVDDKTTELEEKVVKEVADKLNVSEDEVKEAMETLGLTVMDLMDQSNMAMLVTQLTADGDSMLMLTDETVFAGIVELTNDVKELITQEVSALSEELSMDFDETMNLVLEKVNAEAANKESESPVVLPQKGTENPQVTYEVETEGDAQGNTEDELEADIQKAVKEADSPDASQDGTKQTGGQHEQGTTGHQDTPAFANPFQVQNPQMSQTVSQTEFYASSGVDTQDIIDQIAEHVKISKGAEFSEIEIALNPASLGNVHLQVAEREGVITATITTENETVRDALLVQAMILKEELNEQGLKVESVEVTVASHEFEQNMQGESGEEAKQLYEEQLQKQTRQRIMFSDMQEAEEMLQDESLTDAERIQIDMMMKNGSSMDVMA